jgi:hypothetical protein
MSAKQLLRLAAVLAAALVLWGAVALASRGSEGKAERGSILPTIDSAAIDTIALTGSRDTTILTRDGPDRWRVNGKPADPAAMTGLLKALAEKETPTELAARNPSSHPRLRVTDDSGRRVRIVSQGRTLADVIAGKRTVDMDGLYLRRANTPEVYVVRGELPALLERSGDDWRNRVIARVNPDSIGTIEVRRGARPYSLRRKGNGWEFASGAPADSAAVAKLLSDYREIKAAGFGSRAQEDSLKFAKSRRRARLLDRSGAPILSLEFDSIPSGVWVRVADGRADGRADREVYRLDSWTADQLTPADSTPRKR